ncbi:nucleotidyltransferase domain-containing protein [Lysinibacillus sp. NPDC056232]|uniref:nucleotidyltransferase domain-containing protein n=1 Tax=Lysinibacillus sp. NPDC056232 TaxID=3345756 RepID=UPI0035DB6666
MTQEIFDAHTESQLKVLSDISEISKILDIEFWLRGGWAIDFLLGKITRPHDDIDVETWVQNRERFEIALAEAGYEQIPVRKQFCNRQSDFHKNNVEVTIGFITHSDNGSLIMNGLPEWIWRADSLLPQSFMLRGISANVLNPKQLLKEKEVYEQIGRTPRLKDIESKKILHSIISDFSKMIK